MSEIYNADSYQFKANGYTVEGQKHQPKQVAIKTPAGEIFSARVLGIPKSVEEIEFFDCSNAQKEYQVSNEILAVLARGYGEELKNAGWFGGKESENV